MSNIDSRVLKQLKYNIANAAGEGSLRDAMVRDLINGGEFDNTGRISFATDAIPVGKKEVKSAVGIASGIDDVDYLRKIVSSESRTSVLEAVMHNRYAPVDLVFEALVKAVRNSSFYKNQGPVFSGHNDRVKSAAGTIGYRISLSEISEVQFREILRAAIVGTGNGDSDPLRRYCAMALFGYSTWDLQVKMAATLDMKFMFTHPEFLRVFHKTWSEQLVVRSLIEAVGGTKADPGIVTDCSSTWQQDLSLLRVGLRATLEDQAMNAQQMDSFIDAMDRIGLPCSSDYTYSLGNVYAQGIARSIVDYNETARFKVSSDAMKLAVEKMAAAGENRQALVLFILAHFDIASVENRRDIWQHLVGMVESDLTRGYQPGASLDREVEIALRVTAIRLDLDALQFMGSDFSASEFSLIYRRVLDATANLGTFMQRPQFQPDELRTIVLSAALSANLELETATAADLVIGTVGLRRNAGIALALHSERPGHTPDTGYATVLAGDSNLEAHTFLLDVEMVNAITDVVKERALENHVATCSNAYFRSEATDLVRRTYAGESSDYDLAIADALQDIRLAIDASGYAADGLVRAVHASEDFVFSRLNDRLKASEPAWRSLLSLLEDEDGSTLLSELINTALVLIGEDMEPSLDELTDPSSDDEVGLEGEMVSSALGSWQQFTLFS